MDILVSNAYLCSMIARVITMIAVLAFAVVSAATAAHAVRMGVAADHPMHMAGMEMTGTENGAHCGGDHHCGSADAGMCAFVCAGLSVLMPVEPGDTGPAHLADEHDTVAGTNGRGLAPGLNERPPKLRLL